MQSLKIEGGRIARARVAFGGMAGTPKRAPACEAALTGSPWSETTIEAAAEALTRDYQPLSDLRGSAEYRSIAATDLLRLWADAGLGERVSVLDG